MHEPGVLAEETSRLREMKRISAALHELCQPLTTLQCRLEMAELIDTPEACREAVRLGFAECVRLAATVVSMREAVRAAMQAAMDDTEISSG